MHTTDKVIYEIVEVAVHVPEDVCFLQTRYGVMQYVNGIPTGIDFHWLDKRDALSAKVMYELGVATHGRETESSLRRLWRTITHVGLATSSKGA